MISHVFFRGYVIYEHAIVYPTHGHPHSSDFCYTLQYPRNRDHGNQFFWGHFCAVQRFSAEGKNELDATSRNRLIICTYLELCKFVPNGHEAQMQFPTKMVCQTNVIIVDS